MLRVMWSRWWAGRDEEHLAGRKRHPAEEMEEIVGTLRRADELAAQGMSGEVVGAELGLARRKYSLSATIRIR